MTEKIKTLLVFGTRPEAIKMCPLVRRLKNNPKFEVLTMVTAQHRQMLDSVLELFNVKPDFDLNLMKPNQNLWDLSSEILLKTKEIYEKVKIALVFGTRPEAIKMCPLVRVLKQNSDFEIIKEEHMPYLFSYDKIEVIKE